MNRVLLVGAGGFLGSMLRYLVSGFAQRLAPEAVFPLGTLAVNVAGCAAVGFLGGISEVRGVLGPDARAFLVVGILGGFTTFSAFGFETFQLLRDGQSGPALGNVLLQVVVGVAAVWGGFAIARTI